VRELGACTQVGEGFYDVALITLFVLNVPVGFACTVAAKLRGARRLLRQREKAASAEAARRQALALHRAGLADAEDTQVRPA
jgi:hypothetical protein